MEPGLECGWASLGKLLNPKCLPLTSLLPWNAYLVLIARQKINVFKKRKEKVRTIRQAARLTYDVASADHKSHGDRGSFFLSPGLPQHSVSNIITLI